MKQRIIPLLFTAIVITVTGCAHTDKPQNHYCEQITQQLHADAHRHNAGGKLTAIGEAKLMKDYQRYHCEH